MVVGVGISLQTNQFVHRSAIADGVVISGGSHPQIEFTTASGHSFQYTQSGVIYYKAASKVQVLYDPVNPRRDSCNTFGALYGGWLLMGFGGLSAIFVGVLAIFNRVNMRPGRA